MSGKPFASCICTETFVLGDFTTAELNHLADHFVDVQTIIARRLLFDVSSNPCNDLAGSVDVGHDAVERLARLFQIRRISCRLKRETAAWDDDFLARLLTP